MGLYCQIVCRNDFKTMTKFEQKKVENCFWNYINTNNVIWIIN